MSRLSSQTNISKIIEKISHQRGIDLSQYKENFLKRRLDIRMRARGALNYNHYQSILDEDPREYCALFNTLSINVTEFFRDKDVFDALYYQIMPELLSKKGSHEIRTWCAGCASGEEVYSTAILFNEVVKKNEKRFRIIGTDVSNKAIECARVGKYNSGVLKNLSSQLLSTYFHTSSENGYYEVNNALRDKITFDVGDITSSVLPKRLDMILCRNVMIYFDKKTQHELFFKFYDSLNDDGYIVLGKSEVLIGKPSMLFASFMPKERIYRKITNVN